MDPRQQRMSAAMPHERRYVSILDAAKSLRTSALPLSLSRKLERATARAERYELDGAEVVPRLLPASHQEIVERILGDDDRKIIENTFVYPWSAVVHLRLVDSRGRVHTGTGWLIGDRTIITAGHNLFHEGLGTWFASVTVTPGLNGSVQAFSSAKASELWSVKGWVEHADPQYDYGCIILPHDVGYSEHTGWFGFGKRSDDELVGASCQIAGYPGDKIGPEKNTMWTDFNVIKSASSFRLHYLVDTFEGQSGSPVFVETENGVVAVAIHAYDAFTVNKATRITDDVAENLSWWFSRGG